MNLAKATVAVFFMIGVFITGLDGQALTINEVMADPVGSDYYDEFIELYNYGDLAVTLSGYYLEINGYVDTLSFVADYGDVILPHSFALIMDRGYLVSNKSSSYEDLIPENTLLVTIQDSSLARTGLINTGASQIYLFNAQGDTISAVLTTAKPLSGYSWEKIIPEGTNQISNWGNSRNQRGTPGFWNSIAPRNYDVAIEGLKVVSPVDQIFPHQPIDVQFTVKNFGLKAATSVQIICGLDQNSDRQIDEIFYDEMIALAAGDSAMKNATIPGLSSGIYTILAEAIYAADERYDNNLDSLDIKILFSENCLIINEFMYYPATDGGEWVELLNISADTINLKKWMLSDNSTTIMLTGQDFYLPPQKYLVIVNDSTTFISYWGQVPFILDCPKTMPALNNTKDSIIIRDHSAHLIDGLEYSSAWGYRQGVSLERKNSFASSNQASNWSLSTDLDKATPGRRNSIDLRDYDLALDSVKVKPGKSPFQHNSPVTAQIYLRNNGKKPADSFKLNIAIINSFLGTVSDTTITIFSPLQSNESQTVAVTFNAIPGGLHQISAEILWSADETLTNNIANCPLAVGYPTGVLVINEIMFVPLAGQCEWFEIYNRSEITLDLNGWSFRDAMGKRLALADSSIAIKAGEYAVVAARSDFTLDYPEFQELLIVPTAFPTLNNTTDSLFLYDATDNIIDIICYRDSWGGGTGVSLERLDPAQPALNTGNWGGSLIIATPGQTNSIIKLDNDLAIVPSSFKFSKTLDAVGQKVSFSLKIKNVGRNPAENFSIKIYLDQNQDSCRQADELCWRQDINQSLKSDSTLIVTGKITAERAGRSLYLAELEYSLDENLDDNYAGTDLVVAFPAGCLTLNEFLAYPTSNQVEFIECINVSDETIDLSGWMLGNRYLKAEISGGKVPAGGYLILSGDSACFNYFKTDNAAVIIPGKWPGLNNSADQIWLKDLSGKIIDSLYYGAGWPIKAGYSAEKILPHLASDTSQSWALSVSPEHQTAGYFNSVTRPENDLSLDSLQLSAITGDTNTVFAGCYFISNKGQNQACGANLIISLENDLISQISLDCIGPGQADSGNFEIGPLTSGKHTVTVRVGWSEDQINDNNMLSRSIQISWSRGSVLLSEFMPYPWDIRTASSSVAEYFEFYNSGENTIDLAGWTISDQNTAVRRSIPPGYFLPPGEYFVIAGDSSVLNFPDLAPSQTWITAKFPSLSNSEDAVYLYDPTGRSIDSLFYNSTWPIIQGIAMERISFDNSNRAMNWRASVAAAGGTPGQPNSVILHEKLDKLGIKPTADVFSPDGDGIDDEIGIQYLLPFPSAKVTIEIYDLVGRLIYRLATNLETAASGVIYWDGASDYSPKARVGIYIVRCLANDIASAKSVEYITTLVLAR